jgi:hypothetical protein
MQNNLGDAPSPCLTPVLVSKLSYSYPCIVTIPLLRTYIFLISLIKHLGTYNVSAMSSHRALRSTRSYALFRSIKSRPNGAFAQILYYTSY